jgi:hypothetical protein
LQSWQHYWRYLQPSAWLLALWRELCMPEFVLLAVPVDVPSSEPIPPTPGDKDRPGPSPAIIVPRDIPPHIDPDDGDDIPPIRMPDDVPRVPQQLRQYVRRTGSKSLTRR